MEMILLYYWLAVQPVIYDAFLFWVYLPCKWKKYKSEMVISLKVDQNNREVVKTGFCTDNRFEIDFRK